MSYQNLEERLQRQGKKQDLVRFIQQIQEHGDEEYAATMLYILSIANDLERQGIKDFAAIGGYAVLFHILRKEGEKVLPLWRGSVDIDLSASSPSVESVLRGNYASFRRAVSHLHAQKVDICISDEELGRSVTIDLYLVYKNKPVPLQQYILDDNFWARVEFLPIFGINIPVASAMDLLNMKLGVKTPSEGLPRRQDIYDAFTLLGLLEQDKTPARELWGSLPKYTKTTLKKIFSHPDYNSDKNIDELQLLTQPSGQYLGDLRRLASLWRE